MSQSFLKGETPILADEAFHNAVQSYTELFLRSDRVLKAVSAGGLSSQDFRDVFRLSVERRVRSLPDIDGLSKETVLTSWMVKFDAIFKGLLSFSRFQLSTDCLLAEFVSMGRDILNCTSLALSLASGMSSPDLLFRCSLYKDESDVESRERQRESSMLHAVSPVSLPSSLSSQTDTAA